MSGERTEAVERAMAILMAFSAQQPKMTLADLARETGLHKTTILRLTNSMALYGFIDRDPEGRFSIGASVWRLGLIFRRDFDTGETIRPVLRRLARDSGETASFFVRAGEDRVCLYRENSHNLHRFGVEEGMRTKLSTGASGYVLRRFTGHSEDDPAMFNPRGSVTLDRTTIRQIAAISTPVFSRSGQFRGALTMSGPNERFTPERRRDTLPRLEAAAEELSSMID